MRSFSVENFEEVIAVALDMGDDVLESVETAIREHDVQNGVVVSGIGSLAKSRYHIVAPGDKLPWKDVFIEKEGPTEIMCIQGMISDGVAHLHITLSQEDQAFGGHLEKGCQVLTLAEIVIVKFNGKTRRIVNDLGFGRLHKA